MHSMFWACVGMRCTACSGWGCACSIDYTAFASRDHHTGCICLVPRKAPTRLTLATCSKSAWVFSRMLNLASPTIPALLYIMSSLPYMETAWLTAFSTSISLVTSQWTKVVDWGFSSLHIEWPNSSCVSAITTLAPCF